MTEGREIDWPPAGVNVVLWHTVMVDGNAVQVGEVDDGSFIFRNDLAEQLVAKHGPPGKWMVMEAVDRLAMQLFEQRGGVQ